MKKMKEMREKIIFEENKRKIILVSDEEFQNVLRTTDNTTHNTPHNANSTTHNTTHSTQDPLSSAVINCMYCTAPVRTRSRCTVCKGSYCNRDHQKLHWNVHKVSTEFRWSSL